MILIILLKYKLKLIFVILLIFDLLLSISKFINTAGTPLWLYIFKKNGWIENRGDA